MPTRRYDSGTSDTQDAIHEGIAIASSPKRTADAKATMEEGQRGLIIRDLNNMRDTANDMDSHYSYVANHKAAKAHGTTHAAANAEHAKIRKARGN